jgi:hypothetical protein
MDMRLTLVSHHWIYLKPVDCKVTARQHIQAYERRFNGAPSFDEDGNIYVPHPEPTMFVGDPRIHPEIDENWDNLTWGKSSTLLERSNRLSGRYILITKEEAVQTWGENIDDYWDHQRGGYVAGLDMFHTLHCLVSTESSYRHS